MKDLWVHLSTPTLLSLFVLFLLLKTHLPSAWSSHFLFNGLALNLHFLVKMRLLSTCTLSLFTSLRFGRIALFLFPVQKSSGVLATRSFCGAEIYLSTLAGPVCKSFFAEACAILQAFRWSRQHEQICYISSLLLPSGFR